MYRATRASMPVQAPPVQGQGPPVRGQGPPVQAPPVQGQGPPVQAPPVQGQGQSNVNLKNFVNIGIKAMRERIKNDADLVKFLQGVTQSKSNDINKLFSIESLKMINETHKDYVRMKKNKEKDSKKTVAKSDCPPCPPCGQPGSNKSKFGSSSNNNILLLLILLGVVLYFYKKKSSGSLFGKRRRR